MKSLGLVVLGAVACSKATPPSPTPVPSASVTALAMPAEAGRPSPPLVKTRPAPVEPTVVFRRMMTGMVSWPNTRETWTVHRYEHSELVLHVQLDEATKGVRLSGDERDEAEWKNVGEATWSAKGTLRTATKLRLESKAGVWSTKKPRVFEATVTLHCKPMDLPVLAGTATLMPGDACDGNGRKPFWSPGTRSRVKVERCALSADADGSEITHDEWDGRPSFAPEPGVEWVFENSDCAAQEGAYRLIAPKKS